MLPNGREEVRVLGNKEGRNAAIILLVMSFLIIGGLLLAIQYDMADPWVPDMVLYNHTGGEITIYLGWKASSFRRIHRELSINQ